MLEYLNKNHNLKSIIKEKSDSRWNFEKNTIGSSKQLEHNAFYTTRMPVEQLKFSWGA